jgi:hypothetical protein
LNNRFGQGFKYTKACSRKICAEKSVIHLLFLRWRQNDCAKNKSFFHAMATHFDTFFNPPCFHGKGRLSFLFAISFTCSGLAFFSLFRSSLYSLMVLDYFLKSGSFASNGVARIAQSFLNLIFLMVACCAEYPSRKTKG